MVKKIIKKIQENAAKKKTTASGKTKMSAKTRKTARTALSSVGKRATDSNTIFALIEKEAYHLYEKRGFSHGSDQHDWYLAEKKVRTSIKK